MARLYKVKDVLHGCASAFAMRMENDVHRDIFIPSYTFTKEEEDLLNFYVTVMKILFDTSMELSSDEYGTLSETIPSIRTLIGKYNRMINELEETEDEVTISTSIIEINGRTYDNFEDCSSLLTSDTDIQMTLETETKRLCQLKRDFLQNIIDGLKYRFFNVSDILSTDCYLLATALNPRLKLRFFEEEQVEKVKRLVKDEIGGVVETNESRYADGVITEQTHLGDEFEDYLHERCMPETESYESILLYWESRKTVYPKLYQMARKYLCLLSSSCSSERLFSCAGLYCNKFRSRLLPSSLENECILKYYIDVHGIDSFVRHGQI